MNKSIRICVFGIVQGVGFRPFVSRLGHRFSLVGTVCNKGSYVEIMAQGDAQDIDAFVRPCAMKHHRGLLFENTDTACIGTGRYRF